MHTRGEMHTIKWKTTPGQPVGFDMDWTPELASRLRRQYRFLRSKGINRWDARTVISVTVSAASGAHMNHAINAYRAKYLSTKAA